MRKLYILSALLVQLIAPSFVAAADEDQQEKDFEAKKQIYGIQHPWENTMPYGTQYTPPPSGSGPVGDDTEKAKRDADKHKSAASAKHSSNAKKPVLGKAKSTVKKSAPAKAKQ